MFIYKDRMITLVLKNIGQYATAGKRAKFNRVLDSAVRYKWLGKWVNVVK